MHFTENCSWSNILTRLSVRYCCQVGGFAASEVVARLNDVMAAGHAPKCLFVGKAVRVDLLDASTVDVEPTATVLRNAPGKDQALGCGIAPGQRREALCRRASNRDGPWRRAFALLGRGAACAGPRGLKRCSRDHASGNGCLLPQRLQIRISVSPAINASWSNPKFCIPSSTSCGVTCVGRGV